MSKFSEIIKELRTQGGFTQESLAEELKISKSTVAMWETDKRLPSKELYEQLADLFNVDMDYLYGRTKIRKAHHFDEQGDEYININVVSEGSPYYFDEETRQIAQEIFDNKEMRMLFDAARGVDADTLRTYADFLKKLKDKEEGK